jgi:hypothetical protein
MSSTLPLSMTPPAVTRVAADPPRVLVMTALGAAAALGALFALSPLTMAMLAAIGALFVWACAGAGPRERRWIIMLLVVAVSLRAAAILALALTTDGRQGSFHTFFGDGQYALERSLWLRNSMLGIPVAPLDYMEAFKEYGRSGYLYPLAWLQVVFGPAPYALHLMNAVLYLGGAVALFRQARVSFGSVPALGALAVILGLPTLLLWSISPLKESLYFSLSCFVIVLAIAVLRARRWPTRVGGVALVAATVGAIATLRAGGVVMTLGGLAAGLLLAAIVMHRWIAAGALLAGPLAAAVVLAQPVVQQPLIARLRQGVDLHIGHAMTPGAGYRLLDDPEFYEHHRDSSSMSREDVLRYAAASVREFALVPRPWVPKTVNDVVIIPQQLVWYALLLCVLPGIASGLRRDALLTSLLLGNVLVAVAVIAPTSGNIGTLIRHRDMIVPFVASLGALGAVASIGWVARHAKRGE